MISVEEIAKHWDSEPPEIMRSATLAAAIEALLQGEPNVVVGAALGLVVARWSLELKEEMLDEGMANFNALVAKMRNSLKDDAPDA
jgi:urea transporter